MPFNEQLRVLVVDDEPTICRALTIALGRAGYDVVAVEAGEQAHSLLRAEHFDFLVLDLRIPDLRGDVLFELAASIQPHLRYRTLFTTGDGTERAIELIQACGCRWLQKPFELQELVAELRKMAPKVRDATA
jgi:DNA-binding response OmpR family regulator